MSESGRIRFIADVSRKVDIDKVIAFMTDAGILVEEDDRDFHFIIGHFEGEDLAFVERIPGVVAVTRREA